MRNEQPTKVANTLPKSISVNRRINIRPFLLFDKLFIDANKAFFAPAKTVKPCRHRSKHLIIKWLYLPIVLMFITAGEASAWTKYGGDSSCKFILANKNDEAFTERAKGWTFGYISALNEMMQQRFKTPPQDELIWQAVKKFCTNNPNASHYVASATIYIELLRDQGGPQ